MEDLKAEDHDRGENAELRYSLSSADESSSFFSVDTLTAVVIVSRQIDREEHSTFLLTLTASDSANPPLNTSTAIEIIVDDGTLSLIVIQKFSRNFCYPF